MCKPSLPPLPSTSIPDIFFYCPPLLESELRFIYYGLIKSDFSTPSLSHFIIPFIYLLKRSSLLLFFFAMGLIPSSILQPAQFVGLLLVVINCHLNFRWPVLFWHASVSFSFIFFLSSAARGLTICWQLVSCCVQFVWCIMKNQ